MEKQTKTLLGIAIVGIGGYMIYKQMKPMAASTPTADAPAMGESTPTTMSYTGSMVGNRMHNASGNIFKQGVKNQIFQNASGIFKEGESTQIFKGLVKQGTINVKDSGWLRATGSVDFYNTQSSGWLRGK